MNESSTSLSENLDSEGELECGGKNEAYDFARFALVTYVGTPIAIFGLVFNAILVKVFSNRKRLRTPAFYLFLLAIFDSLICAIYIPFFTVDAIAIYYKNEQLYHIWNNYIMFLYGTSRVVQFASTYMVVCATIERFIVVGNIKWLSLVGSEFGRYITAAISLSVILVLRVPAFFDYEVVYLPNCPSLEDYTFVPVLMSREDYAMFNFYVISVVHIIVPFLLLLSLNLLIIALTKKRIYDHFGRGSAFIDMPQISSLLRKESINSNRKHRSELRYATRTMVFIVFTYLICNIFNVFITVMENVFKDNPLMFNEDGSSTKFYTYTADLISIMVAINSFLRIFIYFFCNPQFRFQVVTLCRFSYERTKVFLKCEDQCYRKGENKDFSSSVIDNPQIFDEGEIVFVGVNCENCEGDLKKKRRTERNSVTFDNSTSTKTGDTCYL
ncbi:hypothetical protein FO519_004694 [Halicephalobus sp. NKZ332]|nr:hypothetical protein FO519_004694 [Halicephalobus sp. NKZ332]